MTTLAIILGRAGSKGLPGKNALPIAGRECVRWTIDDAQAAQTVDCIALSSDDQALQQIGLESGLDVVARPVELARDDTPVDDAARHAVEALNDPGIEQIVILYANAPVRPAGLIDRAVGLLISSRADSAQSVCAVGKHHPLWTARLDDAGRLTPWQGETLNAGVFRRQDLPPAYIPDGGVLAVTRDALFLAHTKGERTSPHAFLGTDRRGVATREGEVVDIDTRIDLLVAEAILRERTEGEAR